jgi:DNA-binding transcriptional MerR regulator
VLDRLSLIALGKMAGFSLDEIRGMFGRNQGLEVDRALLLAKADELDRVVRQLDVLRSGSAPCGGMSGAEPPGVPEVPPADEDRYRPPEDEANRAAPAVAVF